MVLCEKCGVEVQEMLNKAMPGRDKADLGHPIVCSDCGKNATVPFEPRPGWKTYCKDCYSKRRG